jgi:hypothetical protein
LVSCYGAIIPKASRSKQQAVQFAYECLSYWIQPCVARTGKMPPVADFYDNGFEANPHWLAALRSRAGSPAPAWLQDVIAAYTDAGIPQWMVDLKPTLQKGYGFPDPMMWPKVRLALAIEFQRYLDGVHKRPADALAALRKTVDDFYKRVGDWE